MHISVEVAEIINTVMELGKSAHFEYVTPELALYVICKNEVFAQSFENCGGNINELDYKLRSYLEEYVGMTEEERGEEEEEELYVGNLPELSQGMVNMLTLAWESSERSGKHFVELPHIIHAMYELEESYAAYYMRLQGVEQAEILQEMAMIYEEMAYEKGAGKKEGEKDNEKDDSAETKGEKGLWRQYAVCLNEELEGRNPLIGRQEELERTMQILCRKEKNNPLHIGEPGVGKTAIMYGLAKLLNENRIPEPLKGAKIFSLDLGSLVAGTQYRGDFEKRLKRVMDSISHEEKPIVYIDEIHNIVGAGAVNGGSFDISNMLKPYLAAGHIRFVGATTYSEYKKHFEKSKSLVRRFQNIDIKEPGVEDTIRILQGLQKNYEEFHGVAYENGVLEYAVEMSAKYINERYLPDKAIDLIDEAGAYRRMHPLGEEKGQEEKGERGKGELVGKEETIGKDVIDEILSKICQIPKQAVESDEMASLATLEERLKNRVFHQEEAIAQVVNAVKFSRAGLLEEGKPLASLLFVGPTGVGKTEIAKSLAEELGIRLIRFDMSEYEEKHAVAKLIGAPAGYVGYEEGGLLTEEIRKHPHSVLLLDEVEKAHPDIYNILLQVMDYATLTDNQGRKADFRNVVIIMTSNAGASRIGKPGIGFQGQDVKADAILEEVKRTFQPEFRNRLNRIVVFQGMNEKMAERIVEKKLGELGQMLHKKKVEFSADSKAKALVKEKGISIEFGAREIERVIQGEIKPLLVDEILFGALKNGGKCLLTAAEGVFKLRFRNNNLARTDES